MSAREKFGLMTLAIFAVLGAGMVVADPQVHATAAERAQNLAGDELIPRPIGVVNHAITIHRSPRDVWPWLAQMGAGRAGWYSYDFIDNGGHRSAKRILPEFQHLTRLRLRPTSHVSRRLKTPSADRNTNMVNMFVTWTA